VKVVEHHTVAEQFEAREAAAGREVAGDRSWLIPPVAMCVSARSRNIRSTGRPADGPDARNYCRA
jgi:nitric oxide synthase oxygenase domain/subunit